MITMLRSLEYIDTFDCYISIDTILKKSSPLTPVTTINKSKQYVSVGTFYISYQICGTLL